MSPDFVWIKQQNTSYSVGHQLYDVVRGAGSLKQLDSSNTTAEGGGNTNQYGYLSSFDSAGFSVTAGSLDSDYVNKSGITYVGWAWDAGTSTVSNPDGSITSQVRANATAGFSVVGYTGTSSNATVGHGLGVTPGLLICKSRTQSGGSNWVVWHSSFTGLEFLRLNTTDSKQSASVVFNSTAPNSTVISLGSDAAVNGSGNTHIIYAFAPVVGYSNFGSYTGNGSADGPFVYTGFRPAFVLMKTSSTSGNDWYIYDYRREAEYNPSTKPLYPNGSFAEQGDSRPIDLLSNGFKIRYNQFFNASGATIIYAAFAESPFQYARAR
jgi:hypothetical protein